MPAIGKIGSFATLQAPNDPLLNTLQNIEQVGFQKRAEDRLIADKKKAEEEKRLAEDVAWDGKFDPTIVGNSKIDDPMLSMAFKAKEQVGQIRRELRNPNLSYDEKVRLNSKLNRISQSFDVANQTPKLLLQKAQEIAKDINNLDRDEVNIVEGIAKQLETGKYEMNYDENGTARIKIYNTDENGKPIGVLKETTLGNLINEFNPSPKSTYKEDLLKYAQSYKVSSTKTTDASGRTIFDKKVNRTPGSRDYQNAMEYAKTILVKPHERKKIAKISGIDVNDEQKLLEYATKDILQAIPDEYENLQDPRLLFDKQKEAKKEAEQKSTIEVVETPPIFEEYNVKPMPGYKTVSVQGGKPIQQIVSVRNGKKVEYNTPFLNAYTVAKNPQTGGRSVAAVITYPDFKSSTLSVNEQASLSQALVGKSQEEAELILSKATKPVSYKTDVVYLTEKDAAKFLPTIGAKDVSEMADKARVGLPTYTRAELKGAGWSDDQINQAVKEGKLNVK